TAVAKKIAPRCFALDEADLLHLIWRDQVIVPRREYPSADGVNDPQRLEPHLCRYAAIAHAEKPAAAFFLPGFVKIAFAGHGHSFAAGNLNQLNHEVTKTRRGLLTSIIVREFVPSWFQSFVTSID